MSDSPPVQPAPTAIVTGSSRGLGRGIAIELAKAGFDVAVHYAGNKFAATETAEECQRVSPRSGAMFPVLGADLGKKMERQSLIRLAVRLLGKLDVFVSNAGIAPPERKDITEASEDSFDKLIEVNLKAPYFLAQDVAGHWLSRGAGDCPLPGGYKMIFVSSISATAASLNRGEYCVSKAGLAMASKLWALRLAEIGQVIELRPGIMATDMTAGVKEKYDAIIDGGSIVPAKRWGNPQDVGRAVRSFAMGDWPFTTGDAVYLDGGFHIEKL
jgi:3-oxoacyl-[acyl-carrier protein] reductase